MLALAMLPGCRLLSREGPVSRSLVTSRQFCQEGVAALEREQWQEAEKVLAQAVKACPTDPEAHRYYAEALWHRDQREKAVKQLEEANRLSGDDATLHVLIAEMRLAMGRVDLARREAEHALDLDPKLPEAWVIRGRVLQTLRQPRKALADYHRALGLAPEDRDVQMEIAQLYRELNQPQRALAALHNLADTWPPGEEPQQVLHLEGLAYMALARYDEAVESLSAASLRNRPTPEILYQLGEAQLLAGRPARAVRAARDALALDPQHRPSRDLLNRVDVARQADDRIRR